MRPVTPFMMTPTECTVFALMFSGLGLFRALRARARGEGRYVDARAGESAFQFLAPMSDVAGRTVAVDHAQRRGAGVGELMEDAGRDVDGLASANRGALFAEAHFAFALHNEVDLLLLLVVPRHLAAGGLESDVSHGE